MQYRPLGRTGVHVSPLCLGAMMFGPWGNNDRQDSIRIIHAALDAGINFVDTADVYSGGVSEEIVGEALRGRRDDVVLATKFFMPMDDRDPNKRGGSRRWIMREVENEDYAAVIARFGSGAMGTFESSRIAIGVASFAAKRALRSVLSMTASTVSRFSSRKARPSFVMAKRLRPPSALCAAT